jgi:long-chain acyl-CoA synthetase
MALVSCKQKESSYSYTDILRLSSRIAYSLRQFGIERQARIGILSENSPEWCIIYIAILAFGGVVVPIDTLLKPEEQKNLIAVSGITVLFLSDSFLQTMSGPSEDFQDNLKLLSISESVSKVKENADSHNEYVNHNISADDPAVLIYTSGTTGDPKGVILTHANLTSNLISIDKSLNFESDTVFLSVLPLFHTFEATTGFLYPLSRGFKICYARSLKSGDLITDIKDNQIRCLIAVPLLYEKMYKAIKRKIIALSPVKRALLSTYMLISKIGWLLGLRAGKILFKPLRQKAGLDSIRYFICGGGPLPAEIAAWFNLIGFCFLEGYGLTECSPVVSVNRPGNIKFGSVGPPLEDVEIEISAPSEDGTGEIKVKGENTTPGYIDNPSATAELLKEGWLFTGDLGRIKSGRLYVSGRAKNLIITAAGKNVYPEELEETLVQSELISEALVVGRKTEGKIGEKVYAIIFPDLEQMKSDGILASDGNYEESVRTLIESEVDSINQRFADYKRITEFELTFEEFKKTSTKKIKRSFYK